MVCINTPHNPKSTTIHISASFSPISSSTRGDPISSSDESSPSSDESQLPRPSPSRGSLAQPQPPRPSPSRGSLAQPQPPRPVDLAATSPPAPATAPTSKPPTGQVMEEQFVLRVPPSVAERIDALLNENAASGEDKSLDLSFFEDGRSGTFAIGNDHFPASLLDLPTVVESYKTYDDSVLIKTADIGQIIMVGEQSDAAPDTVESRHGLTPPMRDARKRRFRREPDLNPELVRRVERDLLNIMAGGTAENVDVEEDGDDNVRSTSKKAAPKPTAKPDVQETGTNVEEPDRSESDDTDDSE